MNQQDSSIPAPSELAIIDAGPGWMVLNKPAGMSVHNDPGRDAISLAKIRLQADAALAARTLWKPAFGPAPAHRLDRETSGLLVLSLTPDTAARLNEAMDPTRERRVRKIYRAVVRGRPPETGSWDQPLTDRAEGRDRPAGPAEAGKACTTLFKSLEHGEFSTLIEVELKTGRQHQIRRHAVLNRCVILGDTRYGEPRFAKTLAKLYPWPERLYLHAFRLEWPPGFIEGLTNLEAPMPEEFRKVLLPPPTSPPTAQSAP